MWALFVVHKLVADNLSKDYSHQVHKAIDEVGGKGNFRWRLDLTIVSGLRDRLLIGSLAK